MAQDNIKNLYDALKSDYDLGSEDDFRNSLKDANNRRNLYKAIEGDYDLGSEQDFEKALGYGNRVNGTNEANKANTTTNTQQRSFTQEEYGRLSPTAQEAAQGVGVAPNNGANETNGADKANVQERKPRVQFVPEASNVKGFTVAKDSPLRRQYPFLDQLDDDEQAFFKTDTNEPLYAWKDSEGKDITPDEAATLNQRADIEQNDAIRPHQVPVTSLYFERGANAGGVKMDGRLRKYLDSILKDAYGDDYQHKTWIVPDGTQMSGDKMLEENMQTVYDAINETIRNARKELAKVKGDKEAEAKINTRVSQMWNDFVSPEQMLKALHDPKGMEEAENELFNINKELQEAYAERDRLNERMAELGERLDKENGGLLREMAAASNVTGGLFGNADLLAARDNNEEYLMLHAAANKNDERIRSLEALRDRDDMNSFETIGRALKNTLLTKEAWDAGDNDMVNARAMAYSGIAKSDEAQEAAQAFMRNYVGANAAAAREDEEMGDLYRWAKIAGTSAAWAKDFLIGNNAMRGLTKGGAKLGVKAAEKLALKGWKKAAMKNLGIAAGDVAGATALATTLQGQSTAEDVTKRFSGDVGVDKDGKLYFKGGDSLGTAIRKGVSNAIVENYTERIGEHIPSLTPLIKKGLGKLGLSKVNGWISKVGTSEAYKTMTKWLKMSGFNGFGNEVIEEELNIALNAIFVGDQTFSDYLDLETQADIVGGMALSMAFMGAGSLAAYGAGKGIDAAQYEYIKKKLDDADFSASDVLTPGKWQKLKDEIDGTANDKMPDFIARMAKDNDMSVQEKEAVGRYVVNLLRMRGHNLKETAEAEEEQKEFAEMKPTGKGVLGDEYDQFKGQSDKAIRFLLSKKNGVAKGALHHEGIGDIDLAWGNQRGGLEHIITKHPDVLDGLQDKLDGMNIVMASDNRIILESDTHKAVVSKMLGQEETPQWLLTAYEKKIKGNSGGSSDIVPEPVGKQNGTAPLQEPLNSDSKDSGFSSGLQGNGGEFDLLSPEERQNVHDDGMIHAAVLYPDAQQGSEAQEVFITKGNVVMNADGTIDTEASDKEIYYKGVDGQVHIVSPDKLQAVAEPISVEDYVAANRPNEANEPDMAEEIVPGQVVNINVDGQTYQATVQGTDGNGNVSVYYQDANGMDRPATFTIDEIRNANRPNNEEPPVGGAGAVVENAEPNGTNEPNASQTAEDRMPIDVSEYFGNAEEAMATAKDIIQNGEVIGTLPDGSVQMQKDGFVATLMPDGNGGMNVTGIERTGNNAPQNIPENGNIGAKNIQQTDGISTENGGISAENIQQEQQIPQDDEGNLIYDQVPVETTIADLYDGSLNDEEVQGFIDANIADAQKKYDSVQKKTPKIGTNKAKYLEQKRKWQADVDEAKRVLDYWNEVNSQKQALTHTTEEETQAAQAELSGQNAREEFNQYNENGVNDAVSVASDFIRGAKITPESFRAETGYGTGEQRRFVGMIASEQNGGKSIDRLAEELVSYDNAELNGVTFNGDTSAAKDAILEALQSAGTRGELAVDNTAEQERYVEARRAELDAQYMEAYGMTYEDYLAYECPKC